MSSTDQQKTGGALTPAAETMKSKVTALLGKAAQIATDLKKVLHGEANLKRAKGIWSAAKLKKVKAVMKSASTVFKGGPGYKGAKVAKKGKKAASKSPKKGKKAASKSPKKKCIPPRISTPKHLRCHLSLKPQDVKLRKAKAKRAAAKKAKTPSGKAASKSPKKKCIPPRISTPKHLRCHLSLKPQDVKLRKAKAKRAAANKAKANPVAKKPAANLTLASVAKKLAVIKKSKLKGQALVDAYVKAKLWKMDAKGMYGPVGPRPAKKAAKKPAAKPKVAAKKPLTAKKLRSLGNVLLSNEARIMAAAKKPAAKPKVAAKKPLTAKKLRSLGNVLLSNEARIMAAAKKPAAKKPKVVRINSGANQVVPSSVSSTVPDRTVVLAAAPATAAAKPAAKKGKKPCADGRPRKNNRCRPAKKAGRQSR